MTDKMTRAGFVTLPDPDNPKADKQFRVREFSDNSVQVFLGVELAKTKDGWADLPAESIPNIRWD
jgi:hypothetical protein